MTRSFAYHRSIAPMMWVLVGLSGVELMVVHLLLAAWYPRAAVVAAALNAGGMLWLMAIIRSFRRLPVTLDDRQLLMRAGAPEIGRRRHHQCRRVARVLDGRDAER
jgi:hypothetical protein